MTAYVTQAQLEDRYGTQALIDLTDRESPATGAVVAEVLDRAIDDAGALIDSYIGIRYALPVSEVPAVMVPIAAAIAYWNLHTYQPTDKAKTDYEHAIRQLEKIADGRMTLPLAAAGAEPARTDAGGARITDRERPFTADNLKGWI